MSSFDDALQDALTTVRLVPRWQLAAGEWSAVEVALARFGTAIASQDGRALAQALEQLEDHGPSRLAAIPRSGGEPAGEPPRPVLDLVNTLVHPTGGWAADSPASAPATGDRNGT
jgi:hypothetical protein